MTVYIEYAFLQNFLFDGTLLWLSLKLGKVKIRRFRLALSALLGAAFALVYPLLSLPLFLSLLLKTAVALLMTLLAFGRVQGKKAGGRYALTSVFFFALTFAFGGALTAVGVEGALFVLLGFSALSLCALPLIKKLHAYRAVARFTVPCALRFGDKEIRTEGFFDSGNGVTKEGVPVCFLSPELYFDLFGELVFKEDAETVRIKTLAGEKDLPVQKGAIAIGKKEDGFFSGEVYFAPSANMISREYKVLLNSALAEGKGEGR